MERPFSGRKAACCCSPNCFRLLLQPQDPGFMSQQIDILIKCMSLCYKSVLKTKKNNFLLNVNVRCFSNFCRDRPLNLMIFLFPGCEGQALLLPTCVWWLQAPRRPTMRSAFTAGISLLALSLCRRQGESSWMWEVSYILTDGTTHICS